ncbi:MAG TPA: hypothetical protein VMT20_07030 [Terriglobia bacterium]|nr:hypothetical protein [Terriglobia bacterium]
MPGYDDARGEFRWVQRGITNRFAGEKLSVATTVEAGGETTLREPEAGKQITLYWVALSSSQENTGEVLASVKLGTETIYEWYLGNPGAFMHWEPVVGAVNAKLILNLSGAQKTAVNFTYTESLPGALS